MLATGLRFIDSLSFRFDDQLFTVLKYDGVVIEKSVSPQEGLNNFRIGYGNGDSGLIELDLNRVQIAIGGGVGGGAKIDTFGGVAIKTNQVDVGKRQGADFGTGIDQEGDRDILRFANDGCVHVGGGYPANIRERGVFEWNGDDCVFGLINDVNREGFIDWLGETVDDKKGGKSSREDEAN